MLYNQETKERIEDALVHFEDAGYDFQIHYDFFCGGRFGGKTYDLLKKINTDDVVEFGDRIYVNLVQKSQIMSWKEYQWYHSELKTAISRMTEKLDDVTILNTTDHNTGIEIKGNTWKFKNIRHLTEKTRYFNYNNNGFSELLIYPEYHVTEGIVIYVREILTESNQKRFDIFNYLLNGDVNVSIERAFGKDCVVKMYEEGEAEKENPYLSNSLLSKHIVAKLNCYFINV